MIPKPIRDVGPPDLQALVDDGVREGKTIEYKLETPGEADREKLSFLAHVSSLANTSGGDLLLGARANAGVPVALPGIGDVDLDAEVLRLEHMLANGLQPRLPRVDVHPVAVDGSYVLLVRVPKSWMSPHRVIKNSKFYGRNSAGRYELDVGELRTAFTLSETISQRIRDFRSDRVAKVYGRETPVPLREGGLMVCHLLPLSAFVEPKSIDPSRFDHPDRMIGPMGAIPYDWRINLDGFVAFTDPGQHGSRAYTQVFRSGAVEAASSLRGLYDDIVLRSEAFEVQLIALVDRFKELAPALDLAPPVYVFLSFVGVHGCRFILGQRRVLDWDERVLTEDVAVLPEVVADDFHTDSHVLLRPAFDLVWNAFGFARSMNYDDEGNWL